MHHASRPWRLPTFVALTLILFAAGAVAQAPPGYYGTVDDTNASTLRATLHEVIDDHTRFPYTSSSTDTWDILNLADEDPNDTGNIIDVYKNASYTKISGGVGDYNREHTWPKSYGFPDDNSSNYPYTDTHMLFLSDSGYNSARSNKPYRMCDAGCTEYTTDFNDGRGGGSGVYPGNSSWSQGSFTQGTWETWDGRKGGSNLIDETGSANPPEVGDAPAGSSIERLDLAGAWQIQGSPTPNVTPLAPPGNQAPVVTITAPSDGSSFSEGSSISFSGTANDAEEGDLTAALSWSSDLDGVIGSGGGFSATLSVGTHSITASVTDSGGLEGSDVISVTVDAAGGPVTVTFTSVGPEDGWVRESSENSGVGGKTNANANGGNAIRAGDNRKDRQYKGFVSFDTSSIPDGATIVSATLRLRRGTVNGTNPFSTHGSCWVDVHSGGLGGSTDLANGDWSQASLDSVGLTAINKSGATQLRIYFDLDDNDDGGNDYIGYKSGDYSNPEDHPQLEVTYTE